MSHFKKHAKRQRKLTSATAVKYRSLLLSNVDTRSAGSDNARVGVLGFFDYKHIYCSGIAPVIENVMKSTPVVGILFKE